MFLVCASLFLRFCLSCGVTVCFFSLVSLFLVYFDIPFIFFLSAGVFGGLLSSVKPDGNHQPPRVFFPFSFVLPISLYCFSSGRISAFLLFLCFLFIFIFVRFLVKGTLTFLYIFNFLSFQFFCFLGHLPFALPRVLCRVKLIVFFLVFYSFSQSFLAYDRSRLPPGALFLCPPILPTFSKIFFSFRSVCSEEDRKRITATYII